MYESCPVNKVDLKQLICNSSFLPCLRLLQFHLLRFDVLRPGEDVEGHEKPKASGRPGCFRMYLDAPLDAPNLHSIQRNLIALKFLKVPILTCHGLETRSSPSPSSQTGVGSHLASLHCHLHSATNCHPLWIHIPNLRYGAGRLFM